tara:strand:- start:1896 stop:2468 length:573 start_codon:yes stop_codon:yes gene_type:complete
MLTKNTFIEIQDYIGDFLNPENIHGIIPSFYWYVIRIWMSQNYYRLDYDVSRSKGRVPVFKMEGRLRDHISSYGELLDAHSGELSQEGVPVLLRESIRNYIISLLNRNLESFCLINTYLYKEDTVWSALNNDHFRKKNLIPVLHLQTTVDVFLEQFVGSSYFFSDDSSKFSEYKLSDFFEHYMNIEEARA